jgi:signal transduction histidine kinase/DNA-binding response OmpR family regulator
MNLRLVFRTYSILLLVVFSFGRCSSPSKKNYVIAFSQCTIGPWRETMLTEMKRELLFHPNVSLIYRQAGGNTQQQIAQTNELLKLKPDLLIISPNEAQPLGSVVEEAFKKGIPVIVIDRKINSPIYTSYVGGDNYSVGRIAGEYAINLLKGKGNVIEITVLPGSSPAHERHSGFKDALIEYPQIRLLKEINGELFKDSTETELKKILDVFKQADLVFAQNDFLAVRIRNFYEKQKIPVPFIIGVDGLQGPGEGMDLVKKGKITATMLYPTGGEEAIQTALKILEKKPFHRQNNLKTTVIDSTNVGYMQAQSEKMITQQISIERQQNRIEEQRAIFNNQRTYLYILSLSLLLTIVLSILAFYSLRENRKINKQLHERNDEISHQKEQLEKMSEEARIANEAKISFFTNISHEFRTPLTLILGPLEEISKNTRLPISTIQGIELIQKNVLRLLRLVNQLMDFRKIQTGKMRIHPQKHDLVSFLNQVCQQFKQAANAKEIDLRFITEERNLMAWFDLDLFEKILFNLLANALKFTGAGGLVHIQLSYDGKNKIASVQVEDNGPGMSREAQQHLFEVFYQGEYTNTYGSGLGLALSKELIELHNGTIEVQSEKGKGTIFVIKFPVEDDSIIHLFNEGQKNELENDVLKTEIYTSDLTYSKTSVVEHENISEKSNTILIIEDNEDLRNFIVEKLSLEYSIVEAKEGQGAIQLAFEVIPDLIICDVIIPGKDGLEVTQVLKNDIRTSHIPIILLTAKASIEQQVAGMKAGADAYATKPFNMQFLQETTRSLLHNRSRLRDHYTSELNPELRTNTMSKLDRKFISDLSALVESNLGNDTFSVEEVSKSMGISRVQLNRKSKALLNMTISDYILNTRLQKAKYLLHHEEFTVSEVAYKVGFTTPAYFSTVFKAKFGTTPKAFKGK